MHESLNASPHTHFLPRPAHYYYLAIRPYSVRQETRLSLASPRSACHFQRGQVPLSLAKSVQIYLSSIFRQNRSDVPRKECLALS